MKHFDCNGDVVKKGDQVEVAKPTSNLDLHLYGFVGTVIDFKEDMITVEDQDGDCFDLESNMLELQF